MQTATLTTLTPVHIGSGQTMQRGFDFVQKDGRIGFLDLDKIVPHIGEASIPQLTAQIEQRKPIMDLPALRPLKIEDISSHVAGAAGVPLTAQELKAHYRTAMQGLCIPGSSIKGAIKTAIWETLMTDEVAGSLHKEDLKNRAGKWKSDKIDVLLFGKDANTKSTRFLKIGDCAFEGQAAEVMEVGIYNAFRNGWDFKNETLLAEVIPQNATAHFSLKLDTDLLKKNKEKYPADWRTTDTNFVMQGTDQLCRLLNRYLLKQLGYEREELEDAGFDQEYDGESMLIELDKLYSLVEDLEKQNTPAFV
ncbi:MAG: type III-A CRISPR-associated RAMP protein Csm5, partial [Bacteroidota bacterium]|nr:type III-A CRISPR-associated RAMP protein Csm5 [Bacteroidota bacterium]